jgi:hypothetical protein
VNDNELEEYLERIDRDLILKHCPGIFLEGLRKTTENLYQDSRSRGRDLKPGTPEYEAARSIPLY